MKKWAFIRMNENCDPEKEKALFKTDNEEWYIYGIRNEDEAIELAKLLHKQGIGIIEVCGAFGEELSRKMYEATNREVPVCYIRVPEDQIEQVNNYWKKD